MSRLSGILRLLGFLKVQRTSWGGEGGGASSRQGSHLGDFHGFVYFHLVLDLGPGLGCQNSLAGGHTCGPPAPPLLVPHLCCVLESPQALLPTTELPISELHW